MENSREVEPFTIILQSEGVQLVQADVLIAGFFRDETNEPALLGRTRELDVAVLGKIGMYRRDGSFSGKLGKVFLFSINDKSISVENLMLIGLGNRNSFSLRKAETIGCLALRNAVAFSFQSIAFAYQLRGFGIDSYSEDDLVEAFSKGIRNEYKALSVKKGANKSIFSFQLLIGET